MTWENFKTIFHSVLDVRLKQRTGPWINSEILQNIRHRDETLNKFRKTKDLDLYKKYCKLRHIVQRETSISKRDYLANKLKKISEIRKKTFGISLKKTRI